MKKLLAFLILLVGTLFPTFAFAQFTTTQGGTGTTSPSGILIGVTGNLHLQTLTVGSNLTVTGTTLSATGGGGGSSTFGTTSISATSPLNWNTSTANLTITQSGTGANGYLSSIDFNTFNNKISSTSLSVTTTGTSGAATYTPSTGVFNIPQYQAGGNYITALTGDVTASGPGSVAATLATVNTNTGSFGGANSIPTFTVNGKGLITAAGSATPSIPASEITSGTFGTGNYTFPADLTVTGNATSTAFFATTASTTKLFGANLQACTGTNALTYSGGLFGCAAVPQGTVTSVSGTTNQITSSGSTAVTLSLPNLVIFPSNATSTLFSTTYGSTTNAFFGTATIPNLGKAAGQFAAFDPNGQLIGTSTPSGSNSAFSPAANYGTVAGLPGYTYVAGVITETLNGALSVDGNNPAVGQRVLVKNESGACTSSAGACNNGLYDVTAAGSGIAAFVLTRDAAYNSSSNVIPGIVTYIISGATLADDFWAMTSASPITIGTTALNYTEVSGGGSSVTSVAQTVPSFLSISGSPITTSGTLAIGYSGTALPIANGGTNTTSFTTSGNGLYWNGTSLLTAPLTSAVTYPYASTTALTATTLCLSTDCRTAWPTSGSVAGSQGQIQYNESGAFGANSGFVLATSTNQLLIGQNNGSATVASIKLFSNVSPPAEFEILQANNGLGSLTTVTLPAISGTLALTSQLTSGTVTSIAAGLGLNGGTITNSGTLSLKSYIATSTADTATQLAVFTSTSATPATLGGFAGYTINAAGTLLTATNASTTQLTVSSGLQIPNSSNPASLQTGYIAQSTNTPFQLRAGSAVFDPRTSFTFGIATSTAWTASTTAPTITIPTGLTWNSISCLIQPAGATLEVQYQYANPTTFTTVNTFLNASSTNGVTTLTTNNTPATNATSTITFGNPTGSPTNASCTLTGTVTGI